MKLKYIVTIENPEQHFVQVKMIISHFTEDKIYIFMPSWSPGSYFMREYSRNIRKFEACQKNGEILFHQQVKKNIWEIDWKKSDLNRLQNGELEIHYEVYCKELTVRTSHVDESHAFLHGPSYLLGVLGDKIDEQWDVRLQPVAIKNPEIEFRFPARWSKLTTSLKSLTDHRENFLYTASDYDELIDTPVEIGCHETNGFTFQGIEHQLAFYGTIYPHPYPLKEDITKIVQTVSSHFQGGLPYENYSFIVHFVPRLFGGLEHLNSTALQFDGRKLSHRKDYLNFLSLVAHEYFHLWNIKRIRPRELGPFDYTRENYSTMLWLAEGLTSFMDDLMVFRSGLSTLEEYLSIVKDHLQNYLGVPGRRYHSLEQSSFNAWIKLYRPDENFKNTSVSYYLKGGLVFMALHSLLVAKGRSIDDLLHLLWNSYLQNPSEGLDKSEVYQMVKILGGEDVLDQFVEMVETTQEIYFEDLLSKLGLEIVWENAGEMNPSEKKSGEASWIGADFEFKNERVFIKQVLLDSPAQKAGLNAQDEIIAINGLRFLKSDAESLSTLLLPEKKYHFQLSRLGKITELEVTLALPPRVIKEIKIIDKDLALKVLSQKSFQ